MARNIIRFWLVVLVLGLCGCALLTNFHFGEMDDYADNPSLALYDGTIKVAGLEGDVNVYRDSYGVPHIFTENEHDLFFATGYVQAQDRLWQMVFMRAMAEGRMAELYGKLGVPGMKLAGMPLSTVAFDRHQRIMGMKFLGEVGEAMLAETNPRIYRQCSAFCDGVNAFIDAHPDFEDLPVEFRVLRVKPEKFRPADIVSFTKLIGSLLCSNMAVELPRHAAIQKYGAEKGWELFPLHYALGPSIVPTDILKNRLAAPRNLPPGGRPSDAEVGFQTTLTASAASKLMEAESIYRQALGANFSLGSNNWVVSGKLTESGAAMFENDPHLQHVEPSVFYLMHLKGAGFDCYGATFAGNPYIVLGHTPNLAWGATTSRGDVQDLFVETPDPNRSDMYRYKGESRPYTVRRETVRVRSGSRMSEHEVEITQSIHGPIINEFAELGEGAPPVALRWTAWDISRDVRAFESVVTSTSVDEFMKKYREMPDKFDVITVAVALEKLMKGDSLDDFVEAMEMVDIPNQNWVAADSAGHIAYLPGGILPLRNKGIGVLPAPGESGEFDWTGFVPLMEVPHAIDPERGYMATANNQVVEAQWYPHIFSTHYGEPWRAMRIEEMIKELAPLDMEDMKRIQNDVKVKKAEWLVPIILKAAENKKPTGKRVLVAVDELKNWDFEADLDSTATIIFFEFTWALFENMMSDEVDKEDLKTLRTEGYPFMLIDKLVSIGESPFFDDKRTGNVVEDMDDMIIKSLGDAMKRIDKKWGPDKEDREWGKIHVMKWFHTLGFLKGKEMSLGPYPHMGADHTVRNAMVSWFGRVPYKTMVGASLKHIMNMRDPEGAQIVIDGSQSGQWLSPHYDDMHKLFLADKYINAKKDPDSVKAEAKYHTVLTP